MTQHPEAARSRPAAPLRSLGVLLSAVLLLPPGAVDAQSSGSQVGPATQAGRRGGPTQVGTTSPVGWPTFDLGQNNNAKGSPRVIRSLVDTVPDDDPLDLGLLALQPPPGVFMRVEQASTTDGPSTAYQVTIFRTGTSFQEFYWLQLPKKFGAEPRPFLLLFHGFGQTASAVLSQTTYDDECFDRNWFLLVPLGASKKGFGALPCQENIELVLSQVFGAFGNFIDRERLYAAGFSMGGGDALNFVARHLDPSKYMFAAAMNHTGGVNRKFGYYNDPNVQWIYEFWHGDSPAVVPFLYEQTSEIDFDLTTLTIDPTNNFSRNLTHLPVHHYEATLDPLIVSSGVSQTSLLHRNLGAIGGRSDQAFVAATTHHWDTVDEHQVCDELSRAKLEMPTKAHTLADREAIWFWFYVEQDVAGAFTPFSWEVDAGANKLDVLNTANLSRITVGTTAAGLDSSSSLFVDLSTTDGLADEVRLLNWTAAPTAVLRDSVATTDWTYNPATGSLTLHETDGGAHSWEIQP